MSDLDDIEEIADQFRLGVNNPTKGTSKKVRKAFKQAELRGAEANRSVEKQQLRSAARRRVVVFPENQS